ISCSSGEKRRRSIMMLASRASMIAIASRANCQRSPEMRRLRLAADVAPKSTAVTRKMLTRMVWPMRVPRWLIRKDGVKTPYRQKAQEPKTWTREIWAVTGSANRPPPHMGLGPERGVTGVAPLSFSAPPHFLSAVGRWSRGALPVHAAARRLASRADGGLGVALGGAARAS